MTLGSGVVPFAERGGKWRGVLDLATGTYPAFLFGGPVGRQLPVFHIHEVTPATLAPLLLHVAENGYQTVTADEVSSFVRTGRLPRERAIALTFDDARASIWTVAAPLLRRHGLRAITFAIPARVCDAPSVRPTMDDGAAEPGTEDDSEVPFATWPELRAVHASGVVDVQSHSLTHAAIFCSPEPVGFVTPAYADEPRLNRPLLSTDGPPRFVEPGQLGAPLYPWRSRLSDGRRFLVAPGVVDRLTGHVDSRGGAAFFDRPGWEAELRAQLPAVPGAFEPPDAQERAIARELAESREALDARLGRGTVTHVALPWGVSGRITRRLLERAGYEAAFAERIFHPKRIRHGSDPFWLMRLNGKFIPCLPGRSRRTFFSTV
jgi:hypothetical protein